MASKFKAIFMGSDEIALLSLEALEKFSTEHNGELVGIFSQPDKPTGRGKKLTATPIAQAAKEKGIALYQPQGLIADKVENAAEKKLIEGALKILRDAKPEVIVVFAYGYFIPKAVRELPAYGCINVHPSLLPKYRGPSPITWAIAAGEKETGVSIIKVAKEMDSGDILLQEKCPLSLTATRPEIEKTLGELSAKVLYKTLEGLLIEKNLKGRPQDAKLVTETRKLEKRDAWIRWELTAEEIFNRFRAFYPWPGTKTDFQNPENQERLTLTIHRAEISSAPPKSASPGTLLKVSKDGIDVATGRNGVLRIIEVQLPGKKPQSISDFLNGQRNFSKVTKFLDPPQDS